VVTQTYDPKNGSPTLYRPSYSQTTYFEGFFATEEPLTKRLHVAYIDQAEVLSQRLGVDPMQLVNWNENLRIWITQTILR